MKKYLIKGALALFAGVFFFSCAEKESEYVPVAQLKVKAFDEVFKEVYGDIDPYQDWGFNSGKTHLNPADESIYVDMVDADEGRAFTRTVAFRGANSVLAFQNRTRTADPRGNMWAKEGWSVPPVITEDQKAIVRQYFQQNSPSYNDPGWTDFWIQQVYEGGTEPTEDCPEVYKDADNHSITGGEQMDHLCSKSENGTEDHVYDFNNAENNDWEGRMLMKSSSTYSFGYINSHATAIHYDKAALVNWRVIAQWAVNNGLEESVEKSVLNDGWNRSYMGFDYELLEEDDVMTDTYVKWGDVPNYNNLTYAYYSSSNIVPIKDGQWQTLSGWDYQDSMNGLRYALSNLNQYTAETRSMKEQGSEGDNDCFYFYKDIDDNHKNQMCLNMVAINRMLEDGFYPKSGDIKTWIKYTGCADGYYSDWIVSLTEAEWSDPTYEDFEEEEEEDWIVTEEGRVFCEDLGRASREDLDYNDVVFDAKIWRRDYYYTKIKKTYKNDTKEEMIGEPEVVGTPEHDIDYYAQITLRAAGGTIPVEIRVNGNEFPVHDQFGDDTTIDMMVNTRDENSTAYGYYGSREPVQLHGEDVKVRKFKLKKVGEDVTYEKQMEEYDLNLIPFGGRSTAPTILDDIEIWSSYGGENGSSAEVLTSKLGESPQKFMAKTTTNWTSERKNISLAYPGFNAWVSDKNSGEPWDNYNLYYLYSGTTASSSSQLPQAIRVQRNHTLEGQHIIWQPTEAEREAGTYKFGYSDDEAGEVAREAWTLKRIPLNLTNVGSFSAGDRVRFYASGMPAGDTDGNKTWITVVIGSITPYFVDCEFPNYEIVNGAKVATSDGCLEVIIDANSANLINSMVSDGHLEIEVQGRNFTLDRICKVDQ